MFEKAAAAWIFQAAVFILAPSSGEGGKTL
jgi:hypothetical protein